MLCAVLNMIHTSLRRIQIHSYDWFVLQLLFADAALGCWIRIFTLEAPLLLLPLEEPNPANAMERVRMDDAWQESANDT
jgi:hypothetical protein